MQGSRIMLKLLTNHFIVFLSIVYCQTIYADIFKEGGDAYLKGAFEIAAKKFKEAAEKGDHRAMYALGSMYAGGTGIEKDYKKAFKWFSSAAKYGRVDAQYKLGLMYEEGAGVTQNYKQAARLYSKVAKKGYAHAQFKFGMLYAKGNGVKQNDVKAYAWLVVAKHNFIRVMPDKGKQSNETAVTAETDKTAGDIFVPVHLNLINEELKNINK